MFQKIREVLKILTLLSLSLSKIIAKRGNRPGIPGNHIKKYMYGLYIDYLWSHTAAINVVRNLVISLIIQNIRNAKIHAKVVKNQKNISGKQLQKVRKQSQGNRKQSQKMGIIKAIRKVKW
jgi:hypothetical protein